MRVGLGQSKHDEASQSNLLPVRIWLKAQARLVDRLHPRAIEQRDPFCGLACYDAGVPEAPMQARD